MKTVEEQYHEIDQLTRDLQDRVAKELDDWLGEEVQREINFNCWGSSFNIKWVVKSGFGHCLFIDDKNSIRYMFELTLFDLNRLHKQLILNGN
jgi:hypothetical protein